MYAPVLLKLLLNQQDYFQLDLILLIHHFFPVYLDYIIICEIV